MKRDLAPLAELLADTALRRSGRSRMRPVHVGNVATAVATFAELNGCARALWASWLAPIATMQDVAALATRLEDAAARGLAMLHDPRQGWEAGGWLGRHRLDIECREGMVALYDSVGDDEGRLGFLMPYLAQRGADGAIVRPKPADVLHTRPHGTGVTTMEQGHVATTCQGATWTRIQEAWEGLALLAPKDTTGYVTAIATRASGNECWKTTIGGDEWLDRDEATVCDHLDALSFPMSMEEDRMEIVHAKPGSETMRASRLAALGGPSKAAKRIMAFLESTGADGEVLAAAARMTACER